MWRLISRIAAVVVRRMEGRVEVIVDVNAN